MPSLLPFVLFALVATLTPGPTNILMLSHGARFGLRATLPLVLGACLAAALIVLAVGLGLGEVLLRYPHDSACAPPCRWSSAPAWPRR